MSARLVSASYGVTEFPPHADWVITGAITVERKDVADGPDTLWNYTSVSVSARSARSCRGSNSDGVGS